MKKSKFVFQIFIRKLLSKILTRNIFLKVQHWCSHCPHNLFWNKIPIKAQIVFRKYSTKFNFDVQVVLEKMFLKIHICSSKDPEQYSEKMTIVALGFLEKCYYKSKFSSRYCHWKHINKKIFWKISFRAAYFKNILKSSLLYLRLVLEQNINRKINYLCPSYIYTKPLNKYSLKSHFYTHQSPWKNILQSKLLSPKFQVSSGIVLQKYYKKTPRPSNPIQKKFRLLNLRLLLNILPQNFSQKYTTFDHICS